MKVGSIKAADAIKGSLRIDPSYYLSEGIKIRSDLKRSPYGLVAVGECASKVFFGNIFSRIWVKDAEHGVQYLAASDTVLADLNTGRYLSKKQAEQLDYLRLRKDWILITCSGTIGNVTYTHRNFEDYIATHDLIRLVPNDNKVLRGILYAFLAGKYGYYQLTQSRYGGVVKHISDKYVESIEVPLFPDTFQVKVDSLIRESSSLREQASDYAKQAIDYFNSKYPISSTTTKFFVKKLKQLKFSWASYNNNLEVEKASKAFEDSSIKLSSLSDKLFAPPLFKHIYLSYDNGYPFMTGSELTRHNMRYYRWLSPRGVRDISDYVVRKGTLLLYKSGTTDGGILGNVFIVDDMLDGCCLSDHVIRVSLKDFDIACWAYAYLRSELGVKALQRLATGTMIPFITPERLAELGIPAADDNFECVVANIKKFIELDALSKKVENEAIDLVEKEIESWSK